jgi:predicted phosphoribosyltransferase
MTSPRFRDRTDAGRRLAEKLRAYAGRADLLVLALPRGGVPVGFELARALGAPLDVLLVRKLGVPGQEELAMGAIASGGVRVLNAAVVQMLSIPEDVIDSVAAQEARELARRERAYRGDRPPSDVRGKTVILVDDGLATGATMRAAAVAIRRQGPGRLVIAVPTAAPEVCEALRADADEVTCATMPEPFYSVGLWYEDFSQTTDDEVRNLLDLAAPASQPYAHLNIWRLNDAGASWDNTTAREIGERLRRQPGFRFYTVIRTSEWEVAALTVFASQSALEAALDVVAPLVRERVRELTAGEPERREGVVLYATGPAPIPARRAAA